VTGPGSADVILDGTIDHGTPEGYAAGCHGSGCPAGREYGFSCSRAVIAERGDFRYKKLRAEGLGPGEMAAALNIYRTPSTSATEKERPAKSKRPAPSPDRRPDIDARTADLPEPRVLAVPVVIPDVPQPITARTEQPQEEPIMPKPAQPVTPAPPSTPATPSSSSELSTAWRNAEQALEQFVTAAGDVLTVLREVTERQESEHVRMRQHITTLETEGRLVRAFAGALAEIKTEATS